LFALLLGACSQPNNPESSNSGSDSDTPQDKPKVGLIMKSLANEFFVNMAEQARQHQTDNSENYDLVINGTKNESDLAQQVSLVNQMIAIDVDAIVIAPADSKALVPVLVKAIEAGIIVVNIDNKLDQSTLNEYGATIPFVGPDNKKGAFMAAEYAASRLNKGDQVIVLEGIPTAFNSQQRRDGFLEAIEESGLNNVALQSANWEQTKAAQVTSSLLIQHPQVSAIFAANDNMALGALASVKRANLDTPPIIVGFDNISAIHTHIESGDILATVDQFGGKLAIFGIENALQAVSGKSLDSVTETPLSLITSDK
jgi:ribose transport system substrate-binding protein